MIGRLVPRVFAITSKNVLTTVASTEQINGTRWLRRELLFFAWNRRDDAEGILRFLPTCVIARAYGFYDYRLTRMLGGQCLRSLVACRVSSASVPVRKLFLSLPG